MNNLFSEIYIIIQHYLQPDLLWHLIVLFFPFVLILEWPFYVLILLGVLHTYLVDIFSVKERKPYFPTVTAILTCYDEGEAILKTIQSFVEQLYRGKIEILVVIDGAHINQHTVVVVKRYIKENPNTPNRTVRLIEKNARGGLASSSNLGTKIASGDLIIKIDGDCSCDNDMVSVATYHFSNPDLIALSGSLRVRNARHNLLTRLQALEYMIGISLGRLGLAKLDMINNISGACSIFRTSFIRQIGGWKNGTAEDLDVTIRIHAYAKRHPNLKIIHDPYAIAHTDVPTTWRALLKQRLRWDGDLYYIYCRRHWRIARPKFLGWKRFIGIVWHGFFISMVLPFSIILYTTYLFIAYRPPYAIAMFLLSFIYYTLVSCLFFFIYWLLISERKKYDLYFALFIPLMPIYQIAIRLWSAIAITAEIVLKTHKDSSMAPWWIIRKTD